MEEEMLHDHQECKTILKKCMTTKKGNKIKRMGSGLGSGNGSPRKMMQLRKKSSLKNQQ